MATPIAWKTRLTNPREDIQARLESAPIEHAQAVLAAYELLQHAQDRGVLDLLRGALGAGGDIITRLAEAANTPESIRTVRNLVSLGRIFASLDPDLLHRLADEVSKSKTDAPPTPSLFGIARRLVGKDSRRVLVASSAFLQAFGRALAAGKSSA